MRSIFSTLIALALAALIIAKADPDLANQLIDEAKAGLDGITPGYADSAIADSKRLLTEVQHKITAPVAPATAASPPQVAVNAPAKSEPKGRAVPVAANRTLKDYLNDGWEIKQYSQEVRSIDIIFDNYILQKGNRHVRCYIRKGYEDDTSGFYTGCEELN